jgi:hypothetical protein
VVKLNVRKHVLIFRKVEFQETFLGGSCGGRGLAVKVKDLGCSWLSR